MAKKKEEAVEEKKGSTPEQREAFGKAFQALCAEHNIGLAAVLNASQNGIIPQMTMVDLEDKKEETTEEVKEEVKEEEAE